MTSDESDSEHMSGSDFDGLVRDRLRRRTNDPEAEWAPFCKSVRSAIDAVQCIGSYAIGCSTDEFVHPGVRVNKVDLIRLPLSSEQAERLAQVGGSHETAADDHVKKTWEIDAKKLSFENPAWEGWLHGVIARVMHELGVEGEPDDVRAELDKLLLHAGGIPPKVLQGLVIPFGWKVNWSLTSAKNHC